MVISLFGGNEPPAAAETPPPAAPTAAGIALARLERVEGSVFLFAAGAPGRTEASAGRDILRGQGLATGKGSLAVVKYPDGTRLEVAEETTLDLFARWSPRRAASPAEGKYLLLRQGMLAAEVAAQPKDAPMILGTPLADVQVLGTRFTLAAAPESTRVEVKEGRVALVRRADRAAVEVRAGQCAEAAPGAPLAAKAVLPPIASTVTVRFGPPGTAVPAGALLDSGDEFDAKRGYGWQGSKERRRSQVNVFRDHQWVTKGREPRAFARAADPTRASGVSAGSAFHAETWTMNLANGRYLVTVCAGDADAAQGPHHVTVEGQAVVVASPTAAGEYVEKQDVPVAVKDGRLTVAVGGHRSALVPNRERPGETTLVSLVIKKIAE
jgi:ferric-dicitrate binding protein FerR (iron transport regulator)